MVFSCYDLDVTSLPEREKKSQFHAMFFKEALIFFAVGGMIEIIPER